MVICDKCKREIPDTSVLTYVISKDDEKINAYRDVHLCPVCEDEFKKFLSNEED